MELSLVLGLLSLGAFVGLMAGLLGIGGGGILVPMLTSIFIYQQVPMQHVVHLALGTSMACITVTSFASMRAHHANGAVLWHLVKLMAPGVVIGTLLGTFLASAASAQALATFFAAFMTYVAWHMLKVPASQMSDKAASKPELAVIAFGIGVVSALVSIGGGSLTVPYLTWRSTDIKKAIGTSAALGFPIAVAGTVGYTINGMVSGVHLPNTTGFIYWPAVLLISITSFFTAPLGAKLTHTFPVKTLKKVFAGLLLLLSAKMLNSVFL